MCLFSFDTIHHLPTGGVSDGDDGWSNLLSFLLSSGTNVIKNQLLEQEGKNICPTLFKFCVVNLDF
jgi:hypothetical protein